MCHLPSCVSSEDIWTCQLSTLSCQHLPKKTNPNSQNHDSPLENPHHYSNICMTIKQSNTTPPANHILSTHLFAIPLVSLLMLADSPMHLSNIVNSLDLDEQSILIRSVMQRATSPLMAMVFYYLSHGNNVIDIADECGLRPGVQR